ncbi:MAG: hypothetical protein AAFR56_07300, partial [Chloroflexota bacterium]
MSFLSQRLGLTRFDADEYYAQALEDYEDKKLQDAIDNIGFAITLLPTNSEYHAVRGLFYMEDGQEYDAKANFEEALRLHRHCAGTARVLQCVRYTEERRRRRTT